MSSEYAQRVPSLPPAMGRQAKDCHQQYLSDAKNPGGYCNHGPNGLTCPVGVAKVAG